MNTIKFTNEKEFATEMHNLELTNIYEDTLFGLKYLLYHPCNLNLFITCLCQNNCNFCINNSYSNTDIKDDLYYYSLDKTLKELKDRNFEITITGGEPTLLPERLVKTMEECFRHNFSCRTFSTTGLNLLKEVNGVPICEHMIKNKFIHNINISRMDINESLNTKILGNPKNIDNKQLELLNSFFKINDAQMRISCNIIKGAVDDFDKMLNFVDFYRNLGIDTVMFRELIGKNSILLEDLVTFDKQFEFIETLNGAFYEVNIYRYKHMIIKYYKTKKNVNKEVIFNLSLRNGILMNNFIGDKLNIDLKGV